MFNVREYYCPTTYWKIMKKRQSLSLLIASFL